LNDVRAQALELLADGMSTEEISRKLGVSKQTIAAYRAHVTMGTYAEAGATGEAAVLEETEDARNLKFGLERDMQQALRSHIDQLDPDLRIVDDGKERHVRAGFIDILAEDQNGSLVAIELKSGEAPDQAITQLLSYIGSLQAETDQKVRGVLVAREFSDRVRLAARAAGIQLVEYGYSFTFSTVTD
jgi:RecB family endonuclease NucS